jgi:hypothetical protein
VRRAQIAPHRDCQDGSKIEVFSFFWYEPNQHWLVLAAVEGK